MLLLFCLSFTAADPVVSASSTNSTPDAAAAAAAPADPNAADMIASSGTKYIRCCCCQRACHIKCLPEEQQQLLAASWAATRQDSTDRDQAKAGRGAKRLRSPRGKKQQGKQEEEQQQDEQERLSWPVPPFFCSPGCKQTATALAQCCTLGAVQLDALPDGTPICWQLIQPAAVAAALAASAAALPSNAAAGPAPDGAADMTVEAPVAADAAGQSAAEARSALADAFAGADPPPAPVPASALLGTGIAPAYTQQQAHVLAQVLRDAQHLLAVQLGPVWEVRTFQHCLPWLLSGLRQPTPGGLLDLSHMHLAVLWVGSTLAAAALLRVHGGEGGGVLEVTLAGTTPQLQHRRLGRMLVGTVERFAMDACKVKQAWMPALGGVVKPCVGVSLLPGWERPDGERGRLQLAPGCSTKLLGLDVSAGSNLGAAAAASRGQAAEEAAQKVPKGVASCWALKLQFGRAANVTDWLRLTKCPLLRYSYVPFVSKRLEPQTMLPMPHFRKQQLARPPPLPPLPPQMQMQPRLAMPQMLLPPYAMQQQQQRPMVPPMQPVAQPVPPHQQQEETMAPAMPIQQQQGVPQGPAAGVGAGAVPEGGQQPVYGQQAAAAAGGQGPDAGEAHGISSQAEQQQAPAQQPPAAAAATAATTDPVGKQQEGEQPQQPQQEQQAGTGNPAPAPSKRQQWKEEMMRQFLSQQRAFGSAAPQVQQSAAAKQQQQPSAAGAADDKAAADAVGGPEPMQE